MTKTIDYYIAVYITIPFLIMNILMATDYIDLAKYYYLKKFVLYLSILLILYVLLFSWWRFESTSVMSSYYPIWMPNKGISSYFLE